MKRQKWIVRAIGFLSLLVLVFTFIPKSSETVVIPLSSAQGPTGKIELSVPRKVYAGDKAVLSARLDLKDLPTDSVTARITGWLETGIEAVEPNGRVQIILQPGSPVEWRWVLRTARLADYSANLWFWWGTDSREQLLLVHEFQLRSEDFFGLKVRTVRMICLGMILFVVIFQFLPAGEKWREKIRSLN